METRKIQYRDKATNQITLFTSEENSGITLICLPAMGVRASYYELFATTLCKHGFNVITVDYRGQGNSSVRASWNIDYGYEEIIGDVKELIEHIDTWFPDTKKIIIGHSLGGQIGSLFESRYAKTSGLILITACSVYYKGWEKWDRMKIRLAANVFYPLSKIVGHFPGNKIGFGGREGRTLIKDWSYNARRGEYQISSTSYQYETSLRQMNTRVLCISIDKDWLATKQAVKNLYTKFHSGSSIVHLHVTPDESKVASLNHFSWAKTPDYFVKVIKEWIRENK